MKFEEGEQVVVQLNLGYIGDDGTNLHEGVRGEVLFVDAAAEVYTVELLPGYGNPDCEGITIKVPETVLCPAPK